MVTTYNRADWLPAALASIRAQEGVIWEAVVVDDASSDGTAELLRQYRTDQRIVAARHAENRGMAAAMNTAFGRSRGQYITRLYGNDELPAGALARMAGILDAEPDVDVVYTDCLLEWRDDIYSGRDGETRILRAGDITEMPRHNVIWSFMARREAYERGGPYDPRLGPAADYGFWLAAYVAGVRFHALHEPLYVYQYHKGGMTYYDRRAQIEGADEARRRYASRTPAA